jgi:hypothetical protein
MYEELKTVKKQVYHLLKEFPETRDSDKELFLKFVDVFYKGKEVLGEAGWLNFRHLLGILPPFESVRRCRAKIQEEGDFQGKCRDRRLREARKVKEYINDSGGDNEQQRGLPLW